MEQFEGHKVSFQSAQEKRTYTNTEEIPQSPEDEHGVTSMSYDMNLLCGEKILEH